MTRTSKPPVKAVRDDEVRALLDRYRCPVPFHMVRTRFLGNIASPVVSASPLDTLKGLWGGELPGFDSLDAGQRAVDGADHGAVESACPPSGKEHHVPLVASGASASGPDRAVRDARDVGRRPRRC